MDRSESQNVIEYPDMQKNTDITQLLDELYFLSEEERTGILQRWEGASPAARAGITAVLHSAKRRQDSFMAEKIAADPTFPARTDAFLHSAFDDIKHAYEEQEKAGLDDTILPAA